LITASQVSTQIDTAWAALNVNEKSYTVNGRTMVFATLDEMQRHINWLITFYNQLISNEAAATDTAVCPVVQTQESE